MEQSELFTDLPETYNLIGLKDACFEFVRRANPAPIECEDMEDYLTYIHDEAMLEFASRMRTMAQQIEDSIYKPQAKEIKAIYKGVFK